MAKARRYRIAKPCSADWDSMPGSDARRFCDQCGKFVHDTTKMTKAAVQRLVDSSPAMPCLRGTCDSDGVLSAFTRRSFALSIANLVPLAALAGAQDSNSLSGLVTDVTGAVIQRAKVTLTNSRGRAIETSSDGNGEFSFADRPAGIYTLFVESPGFQTFTGERLELRAGEVTRMTIKMQLGALTMGGPVAEIAPVKNKLPDKLQIHK
jgi:hypothetical protein